MRLGKTLMNDFLAIISIRKLGRNFIVINFKFSFNDNNFVDRQNLLPENWISYILDYELFRLGVMRGIDTSMIDEEIFQRIKWIDKPIEIKSISGLKFRDKNNNELKDSSSVNSFYLIFFRSI